MRNWLRRIVVPPTVGDVAIVLFLTVVLATTLFLRNQELVESVSRTLRHVHRAAPAVLAFVWCAICVCLLVASILAFGEWWDRRGAGRVRSVRAYMSRRGLQSLQRHDGKLYPTKISPHIPVWPGGRKPARQRPRDAHAWYWGVAEYVLVSVLSAAAAPTLLMCVGQTGGLPQPDLLNPVALIRTWFAVAGAWFPVVVAFAVVVTSLYGLHRYRRWATNRHRWSSRSRRRSLRAS